MTLISDPNSDSRSLMNRKPAVCDGEKNGIPCTHFWSIGQKFDAANADGLRDGEKQRACTLVSGWPLEFTSEEKPTYCNRYAPRKSPGLVNIGNRAIAKLVGAAPESVTGLPTKRVEQQRADGGFDPEPVFAPGYEKYDGRFNSFNPMTPEDIKALRAQYPDKPVAWSAGVNPGSMTIDDIINGPQIGMLKPGEKLGGGLSDETLRALDGELPIEPTNEPSSGIFGASDGIFTKKD